MSELVLRGVDLAATLLREHYGYVRVDPPGRDGLQRVVGIDGSGEERARWMLRANGGLYGAWDPDHVLDRYGLRVRVHTYRRGRRICPLCEDDLTGLRRDATAHESCARELRRKRAQGLNGSGGRRAPLNGAEPGTPPANGFTLRCPDCGGYIFAGRLATTSLVIGRDRIDGPFNLGPRKLLRCMREECGWHGSVARARAAA